MLRWVGEAETCLTKNPHPAQWPTNWEESYRVSPWWTEFMSHTRHLNPWDLLQSEKPPKPLVWRINSAYVQEIHTFWEWTNHRLTCLGPSTKRSGLKSASTICEEDTFTNLKAFAEGAGACWDPLWEIRHWQASFLCSPSTLLAALLVGPIFSPSPWPTSGSSWVVVLSFCPILGDKLSHADSMSRNQVHFVWSINKKQHPSRGSGRVSTSVHNWALGVPIAAPLWNAFYTKAAQARVCLSLTLCGPSEMWRYSPQTPFSWSCFPRKFSLPSSLPPAYNLCLQSFGSTQLHADSFCP